MKHTKRFASLLLVLVMALSLMAVPAMAARETGSITINPPEGGTNITYTIYKIFDLESYNPDTKTYAYKIETDSPWEDFFDSDKSGAGASYVTIDEQGYVTWVEDANEEDFAKAALAYARKRNIVTQGQEQAGATSVTFINLDLGYYLVDSSVGVLCALTTTDPNQTITDKHSLPDNEKKVEEDSTGEYGGMNDADIGQIVNFKSTITANKGAESYVFHDKMSVGLTFDSTSVIITKGKRSLTVGNDYTLITTGLTDGCTFEVQFTQDFCNTLENTDEIVITYTATVNANAVSGTGNKNESKLTYGEEGKFETTPSTTTTYTWSFDVLKYGNSDKSNVLSGAQFVLLNSTKDKVATFTNGKLASWQTIPADDADWSTSNVLTTNTQGKIDIAGLDADTYYLREIQAPKGYNKLDQDQEVKIEPTESADGKTMTLTKVTAEINNQSGSQLPTTGGMGTTVFYVLGGALMLGAVVLFITKKRMGQAEK